MRAGPVGGDAGDLASADGLVAQQRVAFDVPRVPDGGFVLEQLVRVEAHAGRDGSRPRTSSVSEETVPSGSTAVISPFDSVTRPSSCLVAVADTAAASEAAARAGAGRRGVVGPVLAMAASGSRSAVGSAARRAAHASWAISLSRLRSRA